MYRFGDTDSLNQCQWEVLRYMHCTHTTAHSNDTVKHTHCLAQRPKPGLSTWLKSLTKRLTESTLVWLELLTVSCTGERFLDLFSLFVCCLWCLFSCLHISIDSLALVVTIVTTQQGSKKNTLFGHLLDICKQRHAQLSFLCVCWCLLLLFWAFPAFANVKKSAAARQFTEVQIAFCSGTRERPQRDPKKLPTFANCSDWA